MSDIFEASIPPDFYNLSRIMKYLMSQDKDTLNRSYFYKYKDSLLIALKDNIHKSEILEYIIFLIENELLTTYDINELFVSAVGQGMTDIVKLLLKHGADVSYNNHMAIQIVAENKDVFDILISYQNVVEFLINNGHYDLLPKNVQEIFVF